MAGGTAASGGTGRRSAAASTGSAAQTTATGTSAIAHKDAPPKWVTQLVDTFAAAQKGFDPNNARAVVQVMDHYPTILRAMAEFSTNVGKRSVDAVDLPPAAQSMFLELGAMMNKMVGPAETGLSAAKKTVADRIARYLGQRAKDAAWDVRANG